MIPKATLLNLGNTEPARVKLQGEAESKTIKAELEKEARWRYQGDSLGRNEARPSESWAER